MTDPFIGPRYKLIGQKVFVIKVERGPTGMKIHMHWPGLGVLIWDADITNADVRVGDLLTLYTEVPIKMERQ